MQWPSTFEEIAEQYEDVPIGMVVLGYILMALFICGSLGTFQKPLRHRWAVGMIGLVAVGVAVGGGSSLFLLFGGKLNALMLIVLPFFALGIGVNDMFVFVRHFSELVAKASASQQNECSAEDIVCQTLANAGPGALMTSLCNVAIFTSGYALLPVPALADFCASAAIVAVLNYVAILTQVVPFSVLAARDVSNSGEDGECMASCERIEASCAAKMPSPIDKLQAKIAGMPTRCYNTMSVALVICALACLAASAALFAGKDIGYDPAEVVKHDSPQRRPVQVFFDEFNSFPAFLCFDGVDVPQKQREMLDLFQSITALKHSQEGFVPNYLNAFSIYLGMTAKLTGQTPQLDPVLGTVSVAGDSSFYEL